MGPNPTHPFVISNSPPLSLEFAVLFFSAIKLLCAALREAQPSVHSLEPVEFY